MAQTGRSHVNVLLRRSLPALALAGVVWAIASSLFTIDVTEYGLVTRFGRVVRVVAEPGLYVTVPFDRVVRLDKRVLFSRLPRSEYLTVDKKNIVIESLATWRIADPERFLGAFTSEAVAEQLLGDAISATIGSVLGQFPASALISADAAESRYRPIISLIARQVAEFARPAYGIDVISLDLRGLSLPERNRVHVFDRMTAERAKIAKENRSAGELQARKITAEADHERVRIEAEAAGTGERTRAQGDAEASRTYAAAFGQDAKFYQFLRTLQAYDKILDDKTTVFLPADAEVLRMLHFDVHPTPGEPSPGAAAPVGAAGPPQGPNGLSADADRLLKRKSGEELR
jgi:modulator of FtsH protease HflC